MTSSAYAYDNLLRQQMVDYFRSLQTYDLESKPNLEPFYCWSNYSEILEKGEMDIRYALGYFDESYGRHEDGSYSDAIDGIVYKALLDWFERPCRADTHDVLCGFQRTDRPDNGEVMLTKMKELYGQQIKVNLYLTQASASREHADNTGPLSIKQQIMTSQSELNFFGGLEEADIVFYNGHARDGGGPDFKPPVLRESDLHPNYSGYYQVKREGTKQMLQSLKSRPHKNQILGLFACYTDLHFTKDIEKVAPGMRTIVSHKKPDYFTATTTSLGYLDGLLRGGCGDKLGERAKRSFMAQREYLEYNM